MYAVWKRHSRLHEGESGAQRYPNDGSRDAGRGCRRPNVIFVQYRRRWQGNGNLEEQRHGPIAAGLSLRTFRLTEHESLDVYALQPKEIARRDVHWGSPAISLNGKVVSA